MGLCCQSCCKWFCCVMVVSWIVCLVVEIQNSWVCWFRCCSAHGYFVINSESNEHWLRGRSSVNCCPWCHFKSKRLFATMGSSLIVMPVPFAFGFKLLICMVTSWVSKEFSFMMRKYVLSALDCWQIVFRTLKLNWLHFTVIATCYAVLHPCCKKLNKQYMTPGFIKRATIGL